MINILFVCTGNICRSPTAEGVFRHLSQERGIGGVFRVGSAGTDAYHAGEPPDPRAIRIAARHGVDIGQQKARSLKESDYRDYNYIYAMDGGHLYELQNRAPDDARAQISMFLSAATHLTETEVPDPWYGTEKDFEAAYKLIHEGSIALLDKIREVHRL